MEEDGSGTSISWPRAALEAAVTLVVAFALLVIGSNLIVTRVTSLDRDWRAGLATAWFAMSLGLVAWLLRRLQARHLV
ncbi:MAG TPA: hypothetical protein VI916_05040 [Acidimicrobiia bacterium]|nr:hypothetical protein [Acidimicrobiia bacterium]